MPNNTQHAGFSLIEVLVAIVIISIGVLGLVAMQGRTIQFTQDSAQRNTAAMLADDLVEQIRSNRDAVVDASGVRSNSNYYKAPAANFPTTGVAACRTATGCNANQMATDHLVQWVIQVRNSLPVDDATLNAAYIICRDSTPATAACDNLGSAIKIQIAWISRTTENAPEADDANSREFYQISFEP
jgi:type IV pilus assembly protein PilV